MHSKLRMLADYRSNSMVVNAGVFCDHAEARNGCGLAKYLFGMKPSISLTSPLQHITRRYYFLPIAHQTFNSTSDVFAVVSFK
jgi:hypothetical protein